MLLFITSVINTASIIPQLAKAKLPIGALTETSDVIAPTVLMQPGTATGVAGEGIPNDNPPRPDTNPNGPANTPVPAFTRVSELIISALIGGSWIWVLLMFVIIPILPVHNRALI